MRGLLTILLILPLSVTTVRHLPDPVQDSADVRAEGAADSDSSASEEARDATVPTDAPATPEEPAPDRVPAPPIARQLIPDAHAGGTRAPLNARLLLRLPGLAELPGLHNHRLAPWREWQMDGARLGSLRMCVVAPLLHPHAPPDHL